MTMFDESVYQELREGLNTDLPEDYLNFFRSYSGTPPEPNFFWVVEDDWGSGIDDLFVMQRDENSQSLLQALNWQWLPLKPGLIPIGGDGTAGWILLSLCKEEYGSIHFCCTWTDDGDADFYESQAYWKIADSFNEFINNLLECPDEE